MRSKHSAGILVYKKAEDGFMVLLAHMGGPFWTKKDIGAWSIPKGEFDPENEKPLDAAKREFSEEIGIDFARIIPEKKDFIDLGTVKYASGKIVYAFAIDADMDVSKTQSNIIEIEWPPRSGKKMKIPEIDRAEYFAPEVAKQKIIKAQAEFIKRLAEKLDYKLPADPPSQTTLL